MRSQRTRAASGSIGALLDYAAILRCVSPAASAKSGRVLVILRGSFTFFREALCLGPFAFLALRDHCLLFLPAAPPPFIVPLFLNSLKPLAHDAATFLRWQSPLRDRRVHVEIGVVTPRRIIDSVGPVVRNPDAALCLWDLFEP